MNPSLPPTLRCLMVGAALAAMSLLGFSSPVCAQEAKLNNITVASTQTQLTLALEVEGAFTPSVTEAILRGVPATFSFIVTLNRLRNWWFDEALTDTTITNTIKYDSLKKEFLIQRPWSGEPPVSTKSFAEAQRLMTRIRGLAILPLSRMQKGQTYELWAKAELSKMTLPFYLHYVFYFVTFWDFETDWHTIEFVY
jgi:hypothetical protein